MLRGHLRCYLHKSLKYFYLRSAFYSDEHVILCFISYLYISLTTYICHPSPLPLLFPPSPPPLPLSFPLPSHPPSFMVYTHTHTQDRKSFRLRVLFTILHILFFVTSIYFFKRHNDYCEPYSILTLQSKPLNIGHLGDINVSLFKGAPYSEVI